jgi:single-strand DNA-binding protein
MHMSDTITVTGNVATPPEHKLAQGGLSITTFRVASSQRRYDRQSQQWVDAGTNWYTVSAYRRLADHAFRSLRKGDRVVLTGRLKVQQWDNGTKQGTSVEIDAEAIGHDLLWGTSVFHKDAPSRTEAEQVPDAWAVTSSATSEPSESGTSTAGWAVPGDLGGLSVRSDPEGELSAPADESSVDRERELVGADATPF